MASLRLIHQYMTDRCRVLLEDGRVGKIVRVDTSFPEQVSEVSVWTGDETETSVVKVEIGRVIGPAPTEA